MSIMRHAKEMASAIITKQRETMEELKTKQEIITEKPVIKRRTRKTKTVGPDTEIRIGVSSPAVIIDEEGSGGIEELVVISPNQNFSILLQSNGGNTKLEKTWTELSAVSEQAKDIAAFIDVNGNYILNIMDYKWQADLLLVLNSTSGSYKLNQVYANWYVYGG